MSIELITEKAIASGWTRLTCDECAESVKSVVRVGQEPDYDTRWVDLCETCCAKALGVFPPKDTTP